MVKVSLYLATKVTVSLYLATMVKVSLYLVNKDSRFQ